ncbi:MAG TPA: ATP-binding protein, partial [Adhaeribacter sp.]|nr:ATP-binding protein [Adhaeribacter sp.]
MNVKQHQRFTLSDASFLSAVKRDIAKLAAKGAFSETETGRINIVVSEMASNLVRHATEGGELLVKLLDEPDPIGIEIISLDKGPGMAEPQRMLEDGVSTFGSAGEGLGAIKRQSDIFDFYSQPQGGTVMLSRIYKTVSVLPEKLKKRKPEVGAVMISKRNGEVCGDGWSLQESGGATYILAMDGLGHGLAAHEASKL